MRRNNSGCWTAVLLVGLGSTAGAPAEKSEAPPAAKQIAQWVLTPKR